MCLHRERSRITFTAVETAYLARLVPHLPEGLRTSLLVANLDTVPPPASPHPDRW